MIPSGSPVLLDTNVLVLVIRGGNVGQRIFSEYRLGSRADRPLISIVTVGELWALAMKLGWESAKQQRLMTLIDQLVIVSLSQGNILQRYAEIDYHSEKVVKPARPMGQNDLWIAATASATDAWLITTDDDFDHLAKVKINRIRLDPHTGERVA